jgi:hydroxysqualene dehydroxylase
MNPVVHVIGGGLAGLSAALDLAEAGRRVRLYEAGPACGGRARSYEDRQLGCRIDNGNHLLLSANHATFGYLDRIGARHSLAGPGEPIFPFADLKAGLRWTLRLSRGRIPWWVLDPSRRVPGMRLRELVSLVRMLRARGETTVSDCLLPGALADRLLIPLSIAVLNTQPDRGSAALMASMMRESLARGGAACLPWFPAQGLSESLVDPALVRLRALGAEIRTGCRVSALRAQAGSLRALELADGECPLGPLDQVVLAVPAPVAAELADGVLLGFAAPDQFESIVNLHYRITLGDRLAGNLARAGFIGIVGGAAEWAFIKSEVVSVTISAANHLSGRDNEALAAQVWAELRRALSPSLRPGAALPDAMPPWRVLREKRATFAATVQQEALRPGCRTALKNLTVAGDWTATGLPATIEGAIRSGSTAAKVAARLLAAS